MAVGVAKGVASDEAREANESCLYRLQMAAIAQAVIHFLSLSRSFFLSQKIQHSILSKMYLQFCITNSNVK